MTQKVTTKMFILSLLILLAALPAAALAQEMLPAVTVEDQEIIDNQVTIAKVVSEGPGWLVIHIHENDNIGPVIGQSPVVDGENTNIVVEIDPTLSTETLYAMLHTDAGVVGTYEFPGPDIPVTINGEAVTPPFQVIGAMMAEGDEAMMAAVSCQEDYVVQDDDWLSKIAEKFYADVLAFPAIAQATNAHYEAVMMAKGDKALAEGDEAMMAEGDKAMMAEDTLMVEGADGQMMEAMLDTAGKLMVKDADGQMMEVKLDEEGHMMAADGSMVEGKLMLEGADGQMMEVMMADGRLMAKGADGQMMEVAMDDKAMADEAMAGEAMAGDEAMMAGGYAVIENPDIIEPGWVLCIPSTEDAQMLLSGEALMMAK